MGLFGGGEGGGGGGWFSFPRQAEKEEGKEDGGEEGEEETTEALTVAAEEVGGQEGVSDPGSRREAHRVAELDARLKEHMERIGSLEAHLLSRPEQAGGWSVGDAVRWSCVAVALAEAAMEEVGRPVRRAEERWWRGEREGGGEGGVEGGGGEKVWRAVKQGVGDAVHEMGRRLREGGRSRDKEAVEEGKAGEEGSTPAMAPEDSPSVPSDAAPAPPSPVNWANLGARASLTIGHALTLRNRVASHLETHDLDRPKMNEWLAWTLRGAAYVFFLRTTAELWSRRESIQATAALTKKNTEEFLAYRFLEPGKAILEDLILNKRQRLTDEGAITDAQASLRRMLSDFIDDTYPHIDPATKKAALEAMDISLVSAQYDKEIRHAVRNVFSGKIVRMLLIQMQYVKKEVSALQ